MIREGAGMMKEGVRISGFDQIFLPYPVNIFPSMQGHKPRPRDRLSTDRVIRHLLSSVEGDYRTLGVFRTATTTGIFYNHPPRETNYLNLLLLPSLV